MFFPKARRLRVVFVARHNVQRHERPAFFIDFLQIAHLLLENIERLRHADIVRAFRTVYAKTGTHTPREQDRRYFALFDRLHADFFKFFFSCLDCGKTKPRNRGNFAVFTAHIDGVRKIVFKTPVNIFNRIEKVCLFVCIQFVVIFQKLHLSFLREKRFCLFKSHNDTPYFYCVYCIKFLCSLQYFLQKNPSIILSYLYKILSQAVCREIFPSAFAHLHISVRKQEKGSI